MHNHTGPTIGVEPFDTGYAGGAQVQADSPEAMACELVEDGGEFRRHAPPAAERPRRLAFVDGTMRVEARLTRTDATGTVTGLAGNWGVDAVLADGDRPLRFERITSGRAAIFSGGQRVELPPQPGGWSWEPDSITGTDFDAGSERLRRRMRDTEAGIAEGLAAQEWLAVIDRPLHNIRRTRTLPVIGYVKTITARCWPPRHGGRCRTCTPASAPPSCDRRCLPASASRLRRKTATAAPRSTWPRSPAWNATSTTCRATDAWPCAPQSCNSGRAPASARPETECRNE